MGSSPCLPVLASANCGLSPLVINANTHRIWLVALPQAKLTCPGSEATLGFWQAVVISLCTVATLGGHEGSALKMNTDAMAITAARPATASTALRDRGIRARLTLRRPRSMSVWVRSSAAGPRRRDSGQPGRAPVLMIVVRSSSGSGSWSSMTWWSGSPGSSSKGRGWCLPGWRCAGPRLGPQHPRPGVPGPVRYPVPAIAGIREFPGVGLTPVEQLVLQVCGSEF